jgi:hypothetical protein
MDVKELLKFYKLLGHVEKLSKGAMSAALNHKWETFDTFMEELYSTVELLKEEGLNVNKPTKKDH